MRWFGRQPAPIGATATAGGPIRSIFDPGALPATLDVATPDYRGRTDRGDLDVDVPELTGRRTPFVVGAVVRFLLLDNLGHGSPNRVGYFSIKNQRFRSSMTSAPPPLSAGLFGDFEQPSCHAATAKPPRSHEAGWTRGLPCVEK
jgi:hypothetical protein